MSLRAVTFYFDVGAVVVEDLAALFAQVVPYVLWHVASTVCPYAYIASKKLSKLAADTGLPVVWKPVLLGGIYKATAAPQGKDGSGTDVMPAAKRALTGLDLLREARRAGVPLIMNPHHPARSVEALRLILSAPVAKRQSVAEALFRAYWVEGVNIADPAQLGKIATAVGVSANDAAKHELTNNTDEAIAAGAFGVPSFVVSSPEPRLYFGQDRVHFVATAAGVTSHALAAPLRLTANTSPTVVRTVKCYFDFSSPWAYLGVMQMAGFAATHGVTIEYVPILLGALFKEIGTPNVPALAVSEARRAYGGRDLADWSSDTGTPFQFTSTFPLRTVLPLRVAIANPAVIPAIYSAAWRDDKNIGDPEVLTAVLSGAGFDAKALIAAADTAEVKDRLRRNTEAAIAAGMCGVPTYRLSDAAGNDVIVWGQDRLNVVADCVHGWVDTPAAKL